MVKRILKKFLIVILILLILNNFFISEALADVDDVVKVIEGILGGIVGILTLPFRFFAIQIANAINRLTAIIAYTEKPTDTSVNTEILTPFDILYNKVPILDINFFEIGDEENIVNQIRTGVATWYYVLRILASAILLVILIYVGIRMAISTVASDRAMYKKMLVDWVCSLALIFVIQYIIIFTLNINNALVNAMSLTFDSEGIAEVFKGLEEWSMKVFSLDAIGATVIFCMLVWQTIGLLISYFNRMLKIAFLIIISPLITITYSIDKMGDGKAQALGKWLKEFAFTILIQPFHCIIYMCLINVAFEMLIEDYSLFGSSGRESLATALVAILCVRFVKEAEKIVRKIFDFQDDNSGTSLVAGMAASAVVLSNAKKFGKTTRSAVNKVGNLGKNGMNMARAAKVEALAIGAMIANKDGTGKSFEERKEEVRTDINTKKAEKINKKYKGKVQSNLLDRAKQIKKESSKQITSAEALSLARQEQIDSRKQEIKDRLGGAIGDKEAESQAKLELAKERRTKGSPIRNNISKAKGRINDAKDYLNSLETVHELSRKLKGMVSGGAALMVGSGVYGTQGNIATAISAGAATNLGMQEFMKSSTNTIMTSFRENMNNLGVSSPEEAAKVWDEIMDNKDKYGEIKEGSKAEEELDKILNELFGNSEEDEKQKQKITNILKDSPDAAPNELRNLFGNSEKYPEYKTDNPSTEAKLLEFADKHAIASRVESSKEIIPQSQIRNRIIDGYSSNRAYSEEREIRSTIRELNVGKDSEMHEKEDITISFETIKAVEDRYKDKISKLEDKLEQERNKIDADSNKIEEYNIKIQQLKGDAANIIARALSNMNGELENKSLAMAQKYQKELENEINNMTNMKGNMSNNSNVTQKVRDTYQKRFEDRIKQMEKAKTLLDGKLTK